MKNYKNLLGTGVAFTLSFLFLFACSKDESSTGSSTGIIDDNGSSSGKCLLTSIEYTEGWVYGDYYYDDSFINEFLYDAENKIVRISSDDYWYDDVTIEYDQGGRVSKIAYNHNRYYLFTWSGNQVSRQRFYNNYPSSYWFVFNLDNQGKITSIEEWENQNDDSVKRFYVEFTWSGGNLTVMDEYYDSYWWKNTGNKIRAGSRVLQGFAGRETQLPDGTKHGPVGKDFVHAYRSTMTYDNKPSAFGSVSTLSFLEPWMTVFYMSRNNMTSFKEEVMYYDYDWEYSVELVYDDYNEYDYPLRVEIIFDDYWYYYYDEEYSMFWNFGYNCN